MRFAALLGLLVLGGCASSSSLVPIAWRTVPPAAPRVLPTAPHPTEGVVVVANQLFRGTTPLTPRFAAVDSFDVSVERKEVVFSGKRARSFDVGLVSLDGSDIHWIPEDPSDEVAVQWAPKGNKVSYVVRTPTGDLVRTVHVPTATQLSVDFANAVVSALRWDDSAERYAVVVESPDASPRIESMKYGGEGRRTESPASIRLDVAVEPLGGGIVMRPSALRYGETLPLVVWISPRLYAWNDARGVLMRQARVACAVVTAAPDAAFWRAVRDVPWIGKGTAYVVGEAGEQPATVIEADRSLAPDRFAERGNRVFVAPALVQSFAAGYITAQVKGTPPTNGR